MPAWLLPAGVIAAVVLILGLLQRRSAAREERGGGRLDGWFGQRRDRTIEALHAELGQPPDREPLLAFGALMLHRNGEPTRILALGQEKDALREGLAESWDVVDARTAKEALQSLILRGRRHTYQREFAQLRDGGSLADLKLFDGKDYLRWKRASSLCARAGLPSTTADMSAYDYERIAWLARECGFVDYLSEAEVWRCLAWVARAARAQFADWGDYAASFIVGRAATFACDCSDDACCTQRGVDAARALLSAHDAPIGRPHLWQEYPLSEIQVPADLCGLTPDVDPSGTPLQRAQLLGFGALTAHACDERVIGLAIARREPGAHEQWLASSWNVADSGTAAACLDWLLEEGSREGHEEFFQELAGALAPSDLKEVSASAFMRFRLAKERLVQAGFSADAVSSCRSILAYDLERAAYAARLAFSVGYLDEERTWAYLRRIAMLARGGFSSWEAYCTSFLLGQALFNMDGDYLAKLVHSGIALLRVRSPFVEYESPWQRYPMHELAVLHAVRSTGDAP